MEPKRYYQHKIENLLTIPRICTIHYQKLAHGYEFRDDLHNFWELVYADRSDVVALRGDTPYAVPQGHVVFHPPLERHSLRVESSGANVFIVTFACRSAAMEFFRDKVLPVPSALKPLLSDIMTEAQGTFDLPSFDPYMNKLTLLPSPNLGGQQLIRNSLESLLIRLLRDESKKPDAAARFFVRSDSDALDEVILKLLTERVHGRLDLDELEKLTHYGKTHLCTVFKARTGRSVMATYRALKLREAKDMLRDPSMTAAAVAESLCFDSPSHFSSFFRQATGLSPREWRKGIRT